MLQHSRCCSAVSLDNFQTSLMAWAQQHYRAPSSWMPEPERAHTREPRINILFLTLTHYLPESVKITPQMANLASERSIDIYTPNFCRSDLCPGFYSSSLEWFWFWWHHHNDQWWPDQSTGNPLVSLVGFDWVYITINNYLPLPDSNLSQCLDLN